MADKDDEHKTVEHDSNESLLDDVAITAEFEYQEDWDSIDDIGASKEENGTGDGGAAPAEPPPTPGAESSSSAESRERTREREQASGERDSISEALNEFDSYLDEQGSANPGQSGSGDFEHQEDSGNMPAPNLNGNHSNSGAFGYEQPQVSGVFSRYEEETSATDEDFDLFDDNDTVEPHEKTLQELTSEHEKKIRQLNRQLDYQKQVLQVMAELLVEARVISRTELKRRLKALRRKNS